MAKPPVKPPVKAPVKAPAKGGFCPDCGKPKAACKC